MVSRQSKWLLALLLMIVSTLSGQTDDGVSADMDSVVYIEEDNQFIEFDDSMSGEINSQSLDRPLSKSHWESIYNDVDFEEDTTQLKKKKKKRENQESNETIRQDSSKKVGKPDRKMLWYLVAIVVMGIFIWQALKYLNKGEEQNKDADLDFLLDDEQPDEDSLRKANLKTPFQEAYQMEDYRQAFRIRYLDLLKLLMERNHILYKKEKTNLDYMKQVESKPFAPRFSKLTHAFDAIWYGDLMPEKVELDQLFAEFDLLEKEVLNA